MNIFLTNFYLFLMAIVLAILEIQIEGPHGWARNLPTWRPRSDHWLVRVYVKFMSGKEMTGYHLMLFGFILLIFHLPYIFGLTLTWEHWLKTISLFFIFVVLWDFLWFVLNPHYPLKKFKKEHIIFHKKWLWFMPVDYYFGLIISFLVLIPYSLQQPTCALIDWWLINVCLFIIQTIMVILFTLLVLDIDKWKVKNN